MGEDILIPLNRDAQKVLERRKALNDALIEEAQVSQQRDRSCVCAASRWWQQGRQGVE